MEATKLGWAPALRRMGVLALLPTLSVLLVGACQVATDPHGRAVASTLTLGQVLGVAPRPAAYSRVQYATPTAAGAERDRRVVAGRTVEVVAAGTAHRIVVDGQVLTTDADDRVAIQGVYQGGGRTYVLLEEQSGGNACPSMYQAVDLSVGTPTISPQFGNCSDLPQASVGNGALRIVIPAFRAVPAASYVFRAGRLTRLGPASK